jgi:hypothetical protein
MTQYLVLGGHVKELNQECKSFTNASEIQFVGGYDTWAQARDAWKNYSWYNVDNAHMRFFIVPVDKVFQTS